MPRVTLTNADATNAFPSLVAPLLDRYSLPGASNENLSSGDILIN
jgi:hypothetical protein